MKRASLTVAIIFTLLILHVSDVTSRPSTRIKRVSDQRLAELETLLALSKMSGQLVTVPLGYGKVNPKKIGRKRRSDMRLYDIIFNQSNEEDSGGDPLDINYEYLDNNKKR